MAYDLIIGDLQVDLATISGLAEFRSWGELGPAPLRRFLEVGSYKDSNKLREAILERWASEPPEPNVEDIARTILDAVEENPVGPILISEGFTRDDGEEDWYYSEEEDEEPTDNEGGCGTGAGGFKPGNTCAKGGATAGTLSDEEVEKHVEKVMTEYFVKDETWRDYAPKKVYVVGSQARGEARPDSDVDLLVEITDPYHDLGMSIDSASSLDRTIHLNLWTHEGYQENLKGVPYIEYDAKTFKQVGKGVFGEPVKNEGGGCGTGSGGFKPGNTCAKGKGGFPDDVNSLHFVAALGGSTGAQLVQDPSTGKKYVLKRGKEGGNEGHVRSEYIAAQAYEAAGVAVPKQRLYETEDGVAKLSEYLEGRTLNKLEEHELPAAYDEIRKGYAVDAALGNWDVIGLTNDNILIDPQGKAWRIDVGGSLEYRASGKGKGSAWNKDATEYDTLRNSSLNPQSSKVFKGMSDDQLDTSVEAMTGKMRQIIDALPASHQSMVASRMVTISNQHLHYKTSKTTGKLGELTTPDGLTNYLGGKLEGSKFKEAHMIKIQALNPEGIKNGVFIMPLIGNSKEHPSNALNLEHMQKVLPPGTQIKTMWVTKKHIEKGAITSASGKIAKVGDKVAPGHFSALPSQVTPAPTYKMPEGMYLPPGVRGWEKSMTYNEKKAIENWTSSSINFRKAIAADPPPPPKGLSDYATQARDLYNGLMKAPKMEGTYYRGISGEWAESQVELIKKVGVGGVWEDTAPMSTSRLTSKAKYFAENHTMLTIKGKTGRPIEWMSSHRPEAEIVTMPGVKYKILKIQDSDNLHGVKHSIELEEIL